MSTRPRFSVVVPAHNEADTLPAALASLAAQRCPVPYEVIVVDNASTDATAAVAASAGATVVTEPQLGVCRARQTGVAAARGEIVVSTDADTTMPADWLARIDATFQAHDAAGTPVVAVAGPCRYVDPPWWAATIPPLWFAGIAALAAAGRGVRYITATNVAFVRDRFPGYDVSLHQGGDEMDLLRTLRRLGSVVWDRDLIVDTSSRRMQGGTAVHRPGVLRLLLRRPTPPAPPARPVRHHPGADRPDRGHDAVGPPPPALGPSDAQPARRDHGGPDRPTPSAAASVEIRRSRARNPLMARILIPCTPLLGHLQPALVAGQALRGRGHDVDVLTAADFEPLVRDHDLGFRPLPAEAIGRPADRLNTGWSGGPLGAGQARGHRAVRRSADRPGRRPVGRPRRRRLRRRLGRHGLPRGAAAAARSPGIELRVRRSSVSEPPRSRRSAIDAAPFGSGLRNADTRFARRRNRQVNWLLHRGPLRPIHDALDCALTEFGVPAGTVDYFNLLGHFELVVQLSLPELEYPRRELPAKVHCTGPLPVPASARWMPPAWWNRLDQAEGVIHVTQGTVDNADPQRLIVPAVHALRGSGRQIVVTTGRTTSIATRHALDQLRSERVHVAEFVPYDVLLPRTDLMITNGGWGGVQQAARHGVPVIVAGRTEEKAEVGARVAWSGLGLDLRTGTPSPARIRTAVDAVLATGRYRRRAAAIAARRP